MYNTGQHDIQCRDAWPAVLSVLPGKCSGKLDVHWAWYPLSMRHVSLPCHLVQEIVTASVQGAPDKVPVAFHFPSVRQKATGLKAQPERLRYACIILFTIWSKPFVMPDTTLSEYSLRPRSILRCRSSLGSRGIFYNVSEALPPPLMRARLRHFHYIKLGKPRILVW